MTVASPHLALRTQAGTPQVDLYLLRTDEVRDETLLNEYRVLMSSEERAQERRFYFPADQHRYLLTRALVRTVLSQYVDIAPHEWLFQADPYGRPNIVNEHPGAARLSFNISHGGALIVLGVTDQLPLGVDTESVCGRAAPLELAHHFFSASESRDLFNLPPEQQQERFVAYWTLKESYIKARGLGLSLPLDQFAFDLSAESDISLKIDRALNDEPDSWAFWQLRPVAGYLVAVCVRTCKNQHASLTTRKVVPLRTSQMLRCTPIRCSRPVHTSKELA